MRKHFKNKASKYGYIFGKVCQIIGSACIWLSIACLPNENTIITWWAPFTLVFGMLALYYGAWRSWD